MALACLEETIPRALVNEKCVSALEFRMITPNPSSVFGGLTIGNITVHSCAREIERPIEPLSAKAAISALCTVPAISPTSVRGAASLCRRCEHWHPGWPKAQKSCGPGAIVSWDSSEDRAAPGLDGRPHSSRGCLGGKERDWRPADIAREPRRTRPTPPNGPHQ